MKIPTSPLLLTLALSSTSFAYPTPGDKSYSPKPRDSSYSSPNPESSPLLGNEGGNDKSDDAEDAWGMRPETMPGRLSRRWGESSLAHD